MTDKRAAKPAMAIKKESGRARAKAMPSFEESAKKFKPGPVATPESEADRPDMSGVQRTTATGALVEHRIADVAKGRMSDGSPGHVKKMPGESAEATHGA